VGRHTLIELAWLIGELLVTLALTWGAAWAYRMGAEVIWAVGGVGMLVIVLVNLRPLREARAKDACGE
jgi:hypothetical protein